MELGTLARSMSAPSTPLAQSTVPKDLLTASNRNDASLSNLIITSGKIKELENDIAAEEAALESLKEAVGKSEQMANRMTKLLSSFETRMGQLERVVMPVYRNILTMSQMNGRIESTMELVDHLMKANEQVRKEVVILLPGPTMENLTVYLESLTRLAIVCNELSCSELSYCKISIERASAAMRDSQSKVQAAFHSWLQACSQASITEDGQSRLVPVSSEYLVALSSIVKFFEADKTQISSLLATWIELRSNFLASYCEPYFVAAQSFEKPATGYAKGSHPIAQAFREAIQLLQNEIFLIGQILPESLASQTFNRSAQIVRDLAVTSVETMISKMKKTLARREYADQVYLVDATDSAYRAVFAAAAAAQSPSMPAQILQSAVKLLGISVASLFTDLFGEIKGTVPRALERPFVVSETATVYELTSIVMNVIKRMIEFDGPVLDATISQQHGGNWDGSLPDPVLAEMATDSEDKNKNKNENNKKKTVYENTQRYISDILGALETCLDSKSKTLRRPMQTLLFQLNNYNYISQNVQGMVGSYISESAAKRYDQIIEALIRSFTNSWAMIANLLAESAVVVSGSGHLAAQHNTTTNSSPKERIKAFTLEFDEAVKIQTSCSVPDIELRSLLRDKVKELVFTPYIYFYNQNQGLFTGSTNIIGSRSGSKYHDPDQIEDLISHLFEG